MRVCFGLEWIQKCNISVCQMTAGLDKLLIIGIALKLLLLLLLLLFVSLNISTNTIKILILLRLPCLQIAERKIK